MAGLRLEAVRARHWVSPGARRAQPVGFVLDGGPRVYFAGDTGRFEGLAGLVGRISLSFLPVWTWGPHLGPGHLGPRTAAEVVRDIAPAAVVPIHWGTLYRATSTGLAAAAARAGHGCGPHSASRTTSTSGCSARRSDQLRFPSRRV